MKEGGNESCVGEEGEHEEGEWIERGLEQEVGELRKVVQELRESVEKLRLEGKFMEIKEGRKPYVNGGYFDERDFGKVLSKRNNKGIGIKTKLKRRCRRSIIHKERKTR